VRRHRGEDKFREVHRAALSRRSEGAVQPPREDVAGSNVVMDRHDQVREHRLRRHLARKRGKLGNDAVRAEVDQ
jgi:hypothetical protein